MLFYLLVGYVLLQFGWWSYLMVELNNEVYRLKSELDLLTSASPEEVIAKGNELESILHKKWLMIAGEATVFLVLLLIGVMRVRGTFRKEQALVLQQKNFQLSVTHELKSPIASVRLQLETLRKRKLDEQKQEELITNALAETERLNTLVENILLAASIDNSNHHLKMEMVDLSAFVKDITSKARQSLQPSQKISEKIEEGIRCLADRNTFPSILLNLLENAVKYSPSGSEIKVGLRKNGGKIHLSVSDEGGGIPVTEREAVFRKFYRVGNEETRSAKGTGLGLYIVRYLVEKHRGSISVSDNAPKGSTFEITFSHE